MCGSVYIYIYIYSISSMSLWTKKQKRIRVLLHRKEKKLEQLPSFLDLQLSQPEPLTLPNSIPSYRFRTSKLLPIEETSVGYFKTLITCQRPPFSRKYLLIVVISWKMLSRANTDIAFLNCTSTSVWIKRDISHFYTILIICIHIWYKLPPKKCFFFSHETQKGQAKRW